jgi:hypothetical protein
MENFLGNRNFTSVAGSVLCVCVCGDKYCSKVLRFALSYFSKKWHENKYVKRVNGKGKVYLRTGHEGPERGVEL